MAKKLPLKPVETVKPIVTPIETITKPILTAQVPITTTATDFNKLIEESKAAITKAPRVRRTQAEIAAANSGKPQTQPQTIAPIQAASTLSPEQIEMRVKKIAALLQAASLGWSKILIKSDHMMIDDKICQNWSNDVKDVIIAYPELETVISPKVLAVGALTASTAMIAFAQVAIYKAYQEQEAKKSVKPT